MPRFRVEWSGAEAATTFIVGGEAAARREGRSALRE
jgi:hypothetical protein